ncbi:hypothetical protein E4U21_002328 [Claviceps maximensis]|nr:hypothetical protein E4U21_002328 [Claviceps maximensis]
MQRIAGTAFRGGISNRVYNDFNVTNFKPRLKLKLKLPLNNSAAMRAAFHAQNHIKKQASSSAPLETTPVSHQVDTVKITSEKEDVMLAKQRLNRPVAPHLEVYNIDQTYLGSSAWMRITGCTLSGVAYVFFSAYLLVPLLGWHLDSAALVSAFADVPVAVSSTIKFLLAFPLSFHFFNGLKQLGYDFGVGFARTTIIKAEYFVWTAGVVGGLGLTFGL